MTVKNYVVCAHRRIKSTQWVWKDTSKEGDIYEYYSGMQQESLASLLKFLEGEWEYVLFDQEIEHINHAMPLNADLIYNMWHEEPCNILWVGPDVQATQPVEIFGKFNEFRLFNWTDPKSWSEPNQYNESFANLFNNDIQYYPHTMSEDLWKIERDMRAIWDTTGSMNSYNNWQIVNNKMFWSQGLTWEDAHRPELFYQAQWLPDRATVEVQDEWNGCKFDDAKFVHWHGSRNGPVKLQAMRDLNAKNGVVVETNNE